MNQADVIVVGAGSAGCVLASRLAHRYKLRVTLVEPPSMPAPPVDRRRPSRWLNLVGSGDDWNLQAEPASTLAGRRLRWPRGRGLGGSSRINAMIWFPPTPRDLQMLADASGDRWTAEHLAAAFGSIESLVRPQHPLWTSEASKRFMRAMRELADAKPMIYQRVNRQGRRWNPASLLESPRPGNNRVQIVRSAVDQLIWDRERVVGVRLDDGVTALSAQHGVMLCAGTIATPAILMRSGIGPRDELTRLGIDSRREQSCIGNNLQDHLIMPVIFQTKSKSTFDLNPSVRDIARWQMLGSGPIGSNIAECGGLVAGDSIQIHVTPTHYLTFPKPLERPAMTIGVQLTRPSSRGSITLRSSHADDPPRIDARYLTHAADLDGTIQCVRLARSVASETSLAEWVTSEVLPGTKRDSDAAIAKSIARYAQTLYHPVGTCPMGSDCQSPVDGGFALRGTSGLWIADGSVLPELTVGNPNATIMALAWLAAECVAGAIS